ncbi:DUF2179 domain-containing protein [candidate division KSB1 bacterium]
MESSFFALIILPLLIIIARIIDVSLGTLRIIYLAKGEKVIVPILGFFEVLIWIMAIGQIMQNFNNMLYYFAYAIGFASGNFIGMYIEEKLALGNLVFRIFTRMDDEVLSDALQEQNYRVTTIWGDGRYGKVRILFTTVKRKEKDKILNLIQKHNPNAFYTIDEVKVAHESDPQLKGVVQSKRYYTFLFWRRRKGK